MYEWKYKTKEEEIFLKGKNSEGKESVRFVYSITIALIIFLILFTGSIIGINMTRKKLNEGLTVIKNSNMNSNIPLDVTEMNFIEIGNGRKQNNSPDIINNEIDVDLTRFSGFSIIEESMDIGEEEEYVITYFECEIENMKEEVAKNNDFMFKFYDAEGNLIGTYAIHIDELPARENYHLDPQALNFKCVHAQRIEIESIKIGQNTVVEE